MIGPITPASGSAPSRIFIPQDVYVPNDLVAYARHQSGAIYGPEDPWGRRPEEYLWTFDPAWRFPDLVDNLDRSARADWMADEIRYKIEEDREGHYDELLEEDIIEPVVAVLYDGKAFLWDGNHRIGACCMTDRYTCPAVIGTPRE